MSHQKKPVSPLRTSNRFITRKPAIYNVLFPIWMLVWFPSPLWLFLIPGNYLIDRIVLWWSLEETMDRKAFCRRHSWKICLAGFAADFMVSVLLLAIVMGLDHIPGDLGYDLGMALTLNPFTHFGALLITVGTIALAGLIIFLLDRLILRRAGLDEKQAVRSAFYLAVITAPYFFLFPMSLIY